VGYSPEEKAILENHPKKEVLKRGIGVGRGGTNLKKRYLNSFTKKSPKEGEAGDTAVTRLRPATHHTKSAVGEEPTPFRERSGQSKNREAEGTPVVW